MQKDIGLIFLAIRNANYKLLLEYLESGGAPNLAEEKTGNRLLCAAAAQGDVEAGELLLKHGADPNLASHAWPIHFAASGGHIEFVELLLQNDSEVHCLDEDGGTPLSDAAASGHLKVVELLLEAGGDPTYKDRSGKRPILYAAEKGHQNIVKILEPYASKKELELSKLRLQFSGDEQQDKEFIEVKVSTNRGDFERVMNYVEKGGDINACSLGGGTLLMAAANRGRIKILRYLLDQGADPNQVNENGACALDYAINADSSEAYELLFPLTDKKHRQRAERDKERKKKAGFLKW